MNEPLVSIAIVSYNRKDDIIKAIDSCYRQTYKNIEIIFFDNASTDGTSEVIAKKFPEIKIFKSYKNLGCPIGRNLALANCNGYIIFSLDDDAIMDEKCIENVVKSFIDIGQNIGVIACKIIEKGSKRIFPNEKKSVGLFTGCAFAISKNILDKVGYFPDYVRQEEETYLALKILDKGYEIIYNPECIVYHNVSPKNRVAYDIVYYSFKHDIENVFRLLPFFYASPIVLYKLISHFKNYFKNVFIAKYFIDVIRVMLNGISKVNLEKEKIKFSTFKNFRKLNNE
jgi:GT2 family glycosyltransferase